MMLFFVLPALSDLLTSVLEPLNNNIPSQSNQIAYGYLPPLPWYNYPTASSCSRGIDLYFQFVYISHSILCFSEFLNLSWMKSDKNVRAPNILRVTKRFNEVS